MEKKWQTLNLSEHDHNEWKKTTQKDSFVIWALKNNKINVKQYMEWTTHHYRIPFLTESFFYNVTINQQFWSRVKDREPWSNTFLPVYEWDTILFAGCIEPPENIQDKYTVPILATPKNLNIFWNKIEKLSKPDVLYKKKDYPNEPTTQVKEEKTSLFAKPSMLINTIIRSSIITQPSIVTEEEVYKQIFQLSEQYFTGTIIFSFHNNEFTPVEWSKLMSGPATPVKIEKPSIFKMIVKSRSSYHGFIVNNEQHSQFFTPWGFKTLPKHITLIPVFNSSKNIIGAYMGISDKMVDKNHLYKITKWANTLTKPLEESDKQYKNPSA